jgi:hypothetical protein
VRHTRSGWLAASALLAAGLASVLIVPPAPGAIRLPKLLVPEDGGNAWQVRPAHVVYTGDGSGRLGGFDGTGLVHPGHLTWESWKPARAEGSGAVWIDDRGKVAAYRVRVTAFRPLNGHFTRLTLRYSVRGKRYVDRRGIWRTGSYWSYYTLGY